MKLNLITVKSETDWLLLLPVVLLLTLGLVILYSIGLSLSELPLSNFYKQLWFVPVFLFVFLVVQFIDYRLYYHYAKFFYWAGFLLLSSVLIFGTDFRGTTGWFALGGSVWQPVELIKIFWLIWLSYYFIKLDYRERPVRAIVMSFMGLVGYVVLIFLQPDLGSGGILILLWLVILLLLRFPWKYLAVLALIFIIIFSFSWYFILADYQKARLITFISPEADPLGSGYNVRQSIIAIGSGELVGRGFAQGTQSQLRFLPEGQTDFIFAAIGEEFGFIGIMGVVVFLSLLFWRINAIAGRARDNFARILTVGILVLLASQALINMSMNLGLFPVVGIGLPLVSYGRSSLLAIAFALGIVSNISRSTRTPKL